MSIPTLTLVNHAMEPLSATAFTSEPSDVSSPSQASSRPLEDVTSLTSFNPFSEEDENDQSSYALMSSLFSRVKNTFTTPLSSASPPSTAGSNASGPPNSAPTERRRPANSVVQNNSSNESLRLFSERPPSMTVVPSNVAPPLVSLTPVVSEGLSFNIDFDLPLSRAVFINPSTSDSLDGGLYGTTIPGFSIPEDARSIRTATSVKRSASVSKVIRRIRGEGTHGWRVYPIMGVSYLTGLSRDYWMDDKTCKECYDCKSVFTAWRRKHHCRICGSSVSALMTVYGSNFSWQVKYFALAVLQTSLRARDSVTTV